MLSRLALYRISQRGTITRNETIIWIDNFPVENSWRKFRGLDEIFDGAEKRCHELGYKLETFWLRQPGMSNQHAGKILRARGIQGLIMGPQPRAHGHLTLPWDWFSVVSCGYTLKHPVFHAAGSSLYSDFHLALRRLRRLGYVRIGLADYARNHERAYHASTAAILYSQSKLSIKKQIPPLLLQKLSKQALLEWFWRYRPELIITYDLRVIPWLREEGIRVPRDVGVFFGYVPASERRRSGLFGSSAKVGRAAVDLLASIMNRGERGTPSSPIRLVIDAQWNHGKTIRTIHR